VLTPDVTTLAVTNGGQKMSAPPDRCCYPADLGRSPRPPTAGGDVARTAAGTVAVTCYYPTGTARVDGFDKTIHRYAPAFTLTIDDIHTYYVLAGHTPVLVHNCGESVWTPDENYSEAAIAERSAEWSAQAGLTRKHDRLAKAVAADPNYPQRITADGPDRWQNRGNVRGWKDWEDAPIFDMEHLGEYNQIRVMAHPQDG
jgi:hypothetical protein